MLGHNSLFFISFYFEFSHYYCDIHSGDILRLQALD